MFTTPDGVALYTEEDMNEAREVQRTQFTTGTEYGIRATSNDLETKAIAWFRSEILEGTMTKDDALGIYNGLAEALGWTTLDSITSKFTVCVNYNGTTIAEFSDVEADDADSAEDEVRGNLSVDDVELNFSISYGNDSARESVNVTYEFDEEFEFEATEQD
jgi:hypothetical protein